MPGSTHAQNTEACSYEQCALRIKSTFSPLFSSIVQGVQQEQVASLRFFAPIVPEFAARSDTAAAFHAAFRGRHNRGAVLWALGTIGIGVSAVMWRRDDTAGVVIFSAAVGLVVAGAQQLVTGRDRLSQAVWWYNSTLTQP